MRRTHNPANLSGHSTRSKETAGLAPVVRGGGGGTTGGAASGRAGGPDRRGGPHLLAVAAVIGLGLDHADPEAGLPVVGRVWEPADREVRRQGSSPWRTSRGSTARWTGAVRHCCVVAHRGHEADDDLWSTGPAGPRVSRTL
ncbi:hypothetical protein [Streptomyces sp. NPDC001502]|uniref:hypothetical protein n=1 Tax=Streptomyces sp. NPDC001502 TaxID=3364578 RepID=UPI00368DECCE